MKKVLIVFFTLFTVSAFCEVRLGALFAVTGSASFLGMPEKNTLEMLVEEANANGGINGEKIELIIYDTKSDDAEARKKFLRLVKKDRVIAVIGPTTSGESLAVRDLATSEKIPLISCASSDRIVTPINKYIFKVAPSDVHAVEKIFEYLKNIGKKNVGIITAQNGFGDAGRAALLKIKDAYGINVVADEKFRDTDKDMTTQLTKINDKNPDAVIVWGVGPAPALVAKNFRQLGFKSTLVMSHGVASKKFIELAGDSAEGIILPAGRLVVADKLPESDRFKNLLTVYAKSYTEKYNDAISTFGGHAFDAFKIFEIAYLKDKNDIASSIENIKNYLGTYGEFNFGGNDHNGLSKDAFVMITIKNSNWELLGN